MKSTPIIRLCLAGTALALAGCATSGKFACPAPEGVTCLSPQEIYEATNHQDNLEEGVQGKAAALPAGTAGSARSGALIPAMAARPSVMRDGGALALVAPGGGAIAEPGVPVRQPAQIMRIWVAPWADEAGDLHMPGYIYTEIRGRTWSVGQAPASTASQLFDPNAAFRDRPIQGGG